jgi:hypothetical protein
MGRVGGDADCQIGVFLRRGEFSCAGPFSCMAGIGPYSVVACPSLARLLRMELMARRFRAIPAFTSRLFMTCEHTIPLMAG